MPTAIIFTIKKNSKTKYTILQKQQKTNNQLQPIYNNNNNNNTNKNPK
jgi:hypothetical protein